MKKKLLAAFYWRRFPFRGAGSVCGSRRWGRILPPPPPPRAASATVITGLRLCWRLLIEPVRTDHGGGVITHAPVLRSNLGRTSLLSRPLLPRLLAPVNCRLA